MTESFAELFEASAAANLSKLKPGSIVVGTVVDVRTDVVVINAGLKSEGIVPIEQFRNDAGEIDVAVGDIVKVALDSLENDDLVAFRAMDNDVERICLLTTANPGAIG